MCVVSVHISGFREDDREETKRKIEIRYEKKSSISVNCPVLHHAPDDIDHLSA